MATTLNFETGRMRVLSGVDAVLQSVVRELRFPRGDWFLNPSEGVDYTAVFNAQSPQAAARVVRTHVLGIEDVSDARVEIVDFDPSTRTLTLDIEIDTPFGGTAITGLDVFNGGG